MINNIYENREYTQLFELQCIVSIKSSYIPLVVCCFLLIATAAHTILVMTTNSITSSNSSPVVIVAVRTEEEISVHVIYSNQITLMHVVYIHIHAGESVTVGETLLCTVVFTEKLTAMDVSVEGIVNC